MLAECKIWPALAAEMKDYKRGRLRSSWLCAPQFQFQAALPVGSMYSSPVFLVVNFFVNGFKLHQDEQHNHHMESSAITSSLQSITSRLSLLSSSKSAFHIEPGYSSLTRAAEDAQHTTVVSLR
jgi:hypothetical protein